MDFMNEMKTESLQPAFSVKTDPVRLIIRIFAVFGLALILAAVSGPAASGASDVFSAAERDLNEGGEAADAQKRRNLKVVTVQGLVPTRYKRPAAVSIASPKEGYRTTGRRISILGAGDPKYPIYFSGEELDVTENGFFCVYAELELGENVFTFTNRGRETTLTVIREKAEGGGVSEPEKTVPLPEGTWGRVKADYAMTRANTSSQSPELIPITKGTELRLLGTCGSYYQIYDGTYVAKSSIEKMDTEMPTGRVTEAFWESSGADNTITLVLKAGINAPYSFARTENGEYKLTVFGVKDSVQPARCTDDTVASVRAEIRRKDRAVDYFIKVKPKTSVTGCDCVYADGMMKVILKKNPHPEDADSLRGITVLLDPGHGDHNDGAVGPAGRRSATEKSFNLNISLYAAAYLRKMGANVTVTRTDDTFLELDERVELIREIRPDISVSVHGNSLSEETDYLAIHGYRTYYTYNHLNNAADVINSSIISKMGFEQQPIQRASLSLTRLTACPAVLLETVFLSYPGEYEKLLSDEFQRQFGECIAQAISEYMHENAVYGSKNRKKVILYDEGKETE